LSEAPTGDPPGFGEIVRIVVGLAIDIRRG
jgi:hypothetical protein